MRRVALAAALAMLPAPALADLASDRTGLAVLQAHEDAVVVTRDGT